MGKKIEKTYDYVDPTGNLLFQTVRFEGKAFAQRRPYNNHYIWGIKEGWYAPNPVDYYHASDDHQVQPSADAIWFDTLEPCLYQLPLIYKGIKDQKTIFICEGEKDADNLSALGLAVTTNPMGAGKWRKSYTASLKGASQIVILPDNDDPGIAHANNVAQELAGLGIKTKILILPAKNGSSVKDITDWLNYGGTIDELEKIVIACPLWQMPPKQQDAGSNSLIQKYGQPYYLNDKGQVTSVNESFWAGLHFAQCIELYEPNEKSFYHYEPKNGLYVQKTEDAIKQEISSYLLVESRRNSLVSLEKKRSNSTLNNVLGQLRGIAEHKGCFIKKGSPIVHLANGVILLNPAGDADFADFSPQFYSRNQSPISFDENAKCPRFLNELILPAVAPDDALLIQKYVGLCLTGSNLIQRFLILDGLAGRGKSQLANVIQNLVGLNNVSQLRTNLLHERFEIFRFLKKTLLIGVDVPGTFLSEHGAHAIKGLVGGDWMDTEQKNNSGNFQIQGNFCIIITSNSHLRVRFDGDLSAWKRRIMIVRYESPPPAKKIPNFAEILIKEEGPGILNWALHGLSLLLKDIDTIGDIYMSQKQANVVDGLMAESDSLRHFLEDCVIKDPTGDLSITEIIEKYAEYCPVKKWNPKPITVIQREIEGLMLELFQTAKSNSVSRNNKSTRGFRRVRFIQEKELEWA